MMGDPEFQELELIEFPDEIDLGVLDENPLTSSEGAIFRYIIGLVGVFAVIALAFAVFSFRPIENNTVLVNYKVTVARTCFQVFSDYPDFVIGTRVRVYDGANNLLGSGTLNSQIAVDDKCMYSTRFSIRHPNDNIYKVTAGNENRGSLDFTDRNLVLVDHKRTLEVGGHLG